jgi:hypothetical protein
MPVAHGDGTLLRFDHDVTRLTLLKEVDVAELRYGATPHNEPTWCMSATSMSND